MFKKLNYTNCKYLEQEKFIKFCEENSVEIRPHNLEFFEREKLLFPIKRWTFSEEYAIFKHQQIFTSPNKQDYNSSYLHLLKLEEEISKFLDLMFFDKINHPFDEMDKNWQEYLTNPLNNEFTDWKDYEVNYTDKGKSWRTIRAKNYYSYWQIYEIDGINEFRTGFYNVRFDEKENKYYLTCNKEFAEKWTKRPKENILNISSFEHCYNCICDFIQSFERIRNITFKRKNAGEFLTKEESNSFDTKIVELSTKFAGKYNLSSDDFYKFLKILCQRYFIYENKEKSKLQDLIKRDIWYCIQLIFYLTGDTWGNVSSKINRQGQMGTYYKLFTRVPKKTLEIIFPDEIEEIKEEAMLHIDIQLKRYNEKVIQEYKLDKTDIEYFIEFIETNGLAHFLIFMANINKDYFSHEYKSEKNLVFYLRNLSIFIEEIIKTIGLNSISEIKNKYPTKNTGFKYILSPICHNEPWWHVFTELSKKGHLSDINIDNFYDRIYQIPQIIISYQKLDELRKYILVNLARATIIRNYYAHNSLQMDNFKTMYPLLFESLIDSIFIIWAIGKDNIIKNK